MSGVGHLNTEPLCQKSGGTESILGLLVLSSSDVTLRIDDGHVEIERCGYSGLDMCDSRQGWPVHHKLRLSIFNEWLFSRP